MGSETIAAGDLNSMAWRNRGDLIKHAGAGRRIARHIGGEFQRVVLNGGWHLGQTLAAGSQCPDRIPTGRVEPEADLCFAGPNQVRQPAPIQQSLARAFRILDAAVLQVGQMC